MIYGLAENGDYNLVIYFRLKLGGPNLARNHHGVRHQDPWLTSTHKENRRYIGIKRDYRIFDKKKWMKIGNWLVRWSVCSLSSVSCIYRRTRAISLSELMRKKGGWREWRMKTHDFALTLSFSFLKVRGVAHTHRRRHHSSLLIVLSSA